LNNYKFLKPNKDGLWGVFVYDAKDNKGRNKGKKIRAGEKRSQFFYPDRNGEPFIKVEKVALGSDKSFYQYHWNGTKWVSGMAKNRADIPVYRYQEVRKAIAGNKRIVVVEGETSCDALWSIGVPSTTFIGGASKYRSYGQRYKADLEGAELYLCPDRDRLGLNHMNEVQKDFSDAKTIRVYPKSPIWLSVPESGGLDIEDWINEGATEESIFEAVTTESLIEKKSTKDKSREDYFPTIESLVERIDAARLKHGFETPGYKLALIKMAQGSGIKLESLTRLYYEAKLPPSLGRIRSSLEIAQLPEENQSSWLFPDLMPRSWVTLFFANGGTGKTRLCKLLAKAAINGGEFLTEYSASAPIKTLFIQVDEPEEQVITQVKDDPELQHANLHFLTDWSSQKIDSLREQIIEENFELVILDSLMAAQRDSGLDIKDAAYGNLIREFQAIASQTKCSFVVLHHTNRAGQFTGNNSIKDAASVVWELRRYDSNKDRTTLRSTERVLEIGTLKIRAGKENELLLDFDEDEGTFTYLDNYRKLKEPEIKATLIERVLLFFQSNKAQGFSANELSSQPLLEGSSPDSLGKSCRRLRDRGLLFSQKGKTEGGKSCEKYFLVHAHTREIVRLSDNDPQSLIDKELSLSDTLSDNANMSANKAMLSDNGFIVGQHGSTDTCPTTCPTSETPVNTGSLPLSDNVGHTREDSNLKERFSRNDSPSDSSRAPLASYTGPGIGDTVRFVSEALSAAERAALRKKGTEYPWGRTGQVTAYSAVGNGYAVTVVSDGKTFVIKNLLAIELAKVAAPRYAPESLDIGGF
jgi:archaellum biogenesis ATPase FlaH